MINRLTKLRGYAIYNNKDRISQLDYVEGELKTIREWLEEKGPEKEYMPFIIIINPLPNLQTRNSFIETLFYIRTDGMHFIRLWNMGMINRRQLFMIG